MTKPKQIFRLAWIVPCPVEIFLFFVCAETFFQFLQNFDLICFKNTKLFLWFVFSVLSFESIVISFILPTSFVFLRFRRLVVRRCQITTLQKTTCECTTVRPRQTLKWFYFNNKTRMLPYKTTTHMKVIACKKSHHYICLIFSGIKLFINLEI